MGVQRCLGGVKGGAGEGGESVFGLGAWRCGPGVKEECRGGWTAGHLEAKERQRV